jgi:hypothetical protein
MSGKPPRSNGKRVAPKTAKAKPSDAPSVPKATAAKKPAPAASKKGPVALRTAKSPKPAAKNSDKFYIVVEHSDLNISKQKPQSSVPVDSADTFHEAKEKAVDYLIELIDHYERRLWEIKRSNDYLALAKKPK